MPKIPGVNHLDAVRALEKAGFRIMRQGRHIVMGNGHLKEPMALYLSEFALPASGQPVTMFSLLANA